MPTDLGPPILTLTHDTRQPLCLPGIPATCQNLPYLRRTAFFTFGSG
jgi:hypothetical protein